MWILVWETRKILPERGQVNRVAEEAELRLYGPENHESVAMHELAHCPDGRTRSLFSTTEVSFAWHVLLDVTALRDNTSDSLFAPDVRIHEAQYPVCQKKTVNVTFTFDLTRSQRIISNPLWRLRFRFHVLSINPCFIAGYNSFQKVFSLQKFLTDGGSAVSLIECQKSWDKLGNYTYTLLYLLLPLEIIFANP
jgi:hypothetical protein